MYSETPLNHTLSIANMACGPKSTFSYNSVILEYPLNWTFCLVLEGYRLEGVTLYHNLIGYK